MPRSRRASVPARRLDAPDLRRVGVWILAAKLATVALVFDPRAFNAFAVPKATVAYMFSALLVGVLGALALRQGWSVWRTSPVDRAVAAFLAAYVVATVLALNHTVALIGAPDRALGLLTVLDGVVLYASVVVLVRTRTDVVTLAPALFLPIVPVTAYAVVQWAGLDPLPWKLGFQNFSTFGNSAVLSQYLGTLAVAAAALAVLPALGPGRLPRALLLALTGTALAGTLLAGARVALVGFGLAAVVAGPLIVWKVTSGPVRVRVLLGYAGLVMAAAFLFALTPQGRSLHEVLTTAVEARTGELAVGSVAARSVIYDVAVAQVRDRPLFGLGPDNFTVAFGRYRGPEVRLAIGGEAIQTSTHSWALHIATDAGVVGLLAFIAIVGLAVRVALGREAHPIGLAGVSALVFFLGAGLFTVNDPGIEWLPWLALSTCAVSGMRSTVGVKEPGSQKRRSRSARQSGVRTAATVGLALVVAVVLVVQARALWAGELVGRASSARLGGEPRAAAILALRAIEQITFRAEYWHELGLAYAALEDHGRGSQAFERAVALAPYHSTYLTNLARSYVALARDGDRRALQRAVAIVERATVEDPNAAIVHYTRALVMQAAGRPADAVEASERARRLGLPPGPPAYQVAARAYLELDRPADAERWIREILELGPGTAQVDLRLLLARALIDLGRGDEGLSEVKVVLGLDPENERALELQRELAEVQGK